MSNPSQSVAVIGGGVAAATRLRVRSDWRDTRCMRSTSRAGREDRLAPRRVECVDRHGHAVTTRLDHGGVGSTVSSAVFQSFADLALRAGGMAEWKPPLAAGSEPLKGGVMRHASECDAVVLGLPPVQAAPLLTPHRSA
jgi:predicted NAD/FAD-dependent oxidoreductase